MMPTRNLWNSGKSATKRGMIGWIVWPQVRTLPKRQKNSTDEKHGLELLPSSFKSCKWSSFMRSVLFSLATIFLLLACGGTPTPSEADRYVATREAETEARQRYFNCTTDIDDQVASLEKNAEVCSSDYDCRATIAKQIEDLAEKLTSVCAPAPPDLSSDFDCRIELIQAKANLVHGAPNETGPNRILAEDYLADQVKEAYEYCFSLYSP